MLVFSPLQDTSPEFEGPEEPDAECPFLNHAAALPFAMEECGLYFQDCAYIWATLDEDWSLEWLGIPPWGIEDDGPLIDGMAEALSLGLSPGQEFLVWLEEPTCYYLSCSGEWDWDYNWEIVHREPRSLEDLSQVLLDEGATLLETSEPQGA